MSYPHFFLDRQVLGETAGSRIVLDLAPDDAKHARALRLSPGERIAVIDAAGDYLICEVVDVSREGLAVRISTKGGSPAPKPQVRLFQGLSKGDRFEEVLRHATELGVDAFVPLVSERTVVRLDAKAADQRMKRWRAILKSAAMQSGRRTIPLLDDPLPLDSLGAAVEGDDAVLLFWEEAEPGATIASTLQPVAASREPGDIRVSIIIGPEGGFSAGEVEALRSACGSKLAVLTLGDTVLRTETAGVVASALAIYELGGLGRR